MTDENIKISELEQSILKLKTRVDALETIHEQERQDLVEKAKKVSDIPESLLN